MGRATRGAGAGGRLPPAQRFALRTDDMAGCVVADFTMHDTSNVIKNTERLGGSSGRISKTTTWDMWYDTAVSEQIRVHPMDIG